MKESLLHYRRGYVMVEACHPSPERFLNMCSYHGIHIYDLEMKEDKILMKMDVSDFLRLRPLCRKCHICFRVREKRGLPFFFYRNKKRKAFLAGVFLGSALLYIMSGHIWNIHIEGNHKNSTPVILEFLESQKITHGIPIREVSCSKIAAAVRENFPDVTWVSAKIVGTRLMLTIQENPEKEILEIVEEEEPCSLIAPVSGKIVEIITKRGVPQIFPGDTCEKGDLLVSGCIDIKNDSQEVIRTEYVPAQADILLERTLEYEDSFPLLHEEKEFTGESRVSIGIWAGSCFAETGFLKKGQRESDLSVEQWPVYLTENFKLPITIQRKEELFCTKKEEIYTETQAKELALQNMEVFHRKLIEKGVQIYQNNVTIETDERICRSQGTIVIREYVGEKVPIAMEPAPAERTILDESASH